VPRAKPVKKDAAIDRSADKANGNGDFSKASKPSKVAKSASKELKPANATQTKEIKQPKPADPASDAEDGNEDEAEGEDDESEIDDQTEALLKGFESDGDNEDTNNEGGLKEGDEVPKAPISNRSKKQLQKASDFPKDDKPGVVYVGRIPHGFYEHEMREYFKQFGTILMLRMSRNRRTGASRHIAWIQFESATVAEIVAKTMDNYLLFGHILKVKVVPDAQVSANLWKGANRRFKKVPWNKMEGRRLALAKPEDAWEKQTERERGRRDKKAEKMKAIGYEFEAPKLKSAKGVAKKAEQPALVTDGEVEIKTIEATTTVSADLKKEEKKEKKKEKKAKGIEESKAAPVAEESSKSKKEKKRYAAEVDEAPADATAVAPAESAEKGLKTKMAKTVLVEATSEVSEGKAKRPRIRNKVKTTA
jgi:nucleolar protein 15